MEIILEAKEYEIETRIEDNVLCYGCSLNSKKCIARVEE